MRWVSIFLVVCIVSCAIIPPKHEYYEYKFKLVEPVADENFHYEDDNIDVKFVILPNELLIDIDNKRDHQIFPLYDEAVYVDQYAHSHAVVYSTLSLLTADRYKPPSSVPPGSAVLNYYAPIDKLTPFHRFVLVEPFVRKAPADLPESQRSAYLKQLDEKAQANIERRIGIFLPIQMGDEVINYFFKFEIKDVTIPLPKPISIKLSRRDAIILAGSSAVGILIVIAGLSGK